jgi:transcriptional regulator with XRE-family HTH domain
MMDTMVGVDKDKLRRLRLGVGLTQIQLAEQAGISPDTIVRWEAGKGTRPHPGSLMKLSKALGVTPDALLED